MPPKKVTIIFQEPKIVLFDIFNNLETKPIVIAFGHNYEGNQLISELLFNFKRSLFE